MKSARLGIVLVLFCSILFISLSLSAAQNRVTYQPIPSGFDFPAKESDLISFRDTENVSAMRRHAWLVFAGMTQPTSTGEAVWETWFSADETFQSGPSPQGLVPRKIQRKFQVPRQFKSTERGPNPQAVGASLASFTLFDLETRKHIRDNGFNKQVKLRSLNAGFSGNAPIENRTITPFPREAVALKTAWWVVKKNGLTSIPIWDPIPTQANQPPLDYPTWKRAMAVDPSRSQIPSDETANISFNGQPRPGSHVVPLSSFYYFSMTADDVAALKRLENFIPNASTAQAGDFLVLIALHYTTKEISDWVWATFWWHDRPNDGPFAADRPDEVKNVWRNYLMDTTLSMDTPKESDGNPNACFNPWLEARFQDGVNSNCMTCHQKSVWLPGPFLPVTRGALQPNDQFYAGKMKLDFLWSLGFDSQ